MKSMLIEYKEVQVLVPTYPVVNCYAEDYKPTVAEMILVPSMVLSGTNDEDPRAYRCSGSGRGQRYVVFLFVR